MAETILVTGGAGYIGSHTVQQLTGRGESLVVLDNFSTGFRQSVAGLPLVQGDVGDTKLVGELLAKHGHPHGDPFRRAHHRARVGVRPAQVLRQQHLPDAQPARHLRRAWRRELRVLLHRCGVRHSRIGTVRRGFAAAPINPYGTSKLMSEWMLRDLAFATGMRYVALRYFNVAGSDPHGRIGQSTRKATLLVKVAAEAVVGKREHVSIFGTDYPTPDGTGVRDYIHVVDLANAHLKAVDYLRGGGASVTLNCG